MSRLIKWLSVGAVAIIGTQVPIATARSADFIPTGASADAPVGFLSMCMRDNTLCRAGIPGPDQRPIALTFAPVPPAPASSMAAPCDVASTPIVPMPRQRYTAFSMILSAGAWDDTDGEVSLCQVPVGTRQPADTMAAAQITQPPIPIVGQPLAVTGALAGTAAVPSSRADFGRYDPNEVVTASRKTTDDAKLIRLINQQVNRQVVRVSDIASRGVEEEWDRPGRIGRPAGDCEDFAIEKRMRLVEAGFPPEKLFFAVVYRANFGLHVVLIARLVDGDYVLDSANPQVVRWTQTRYTWLRAQSPTNPLLWTRVAPASES